MCVLQLEDMFGTIGVTVFPRTYQEYIEDLEEGTVVIIKGELQLRRDELGILCNSIERLKRVEEEMNRKRYQVWLRLERSGDDEISVSDDVLKVQEIYRHLTERPGRDHYEIVIANGEWEARLTPNNNTMHYTDELRAKLESVLGMDMVEVQELDSIAV